MEIAAAGDENVCLQFSAEFLYISAKWCLRCVIVQCYEGWEVTMAIFFR